MEAITIKWKINGNVFKVEMVLKYLNQLVKLGHLKRGTTKHVPLDAMPQSPREVSCLSLNQM